MSGECTSVCQYCLGCSWEAPGSCCLTKNHAQPTGKFVQTRLEVLQDTVVGIPTEEDLQAMWERQALSSGVMVEVDAMRLFHFQHTELWGRLVGQHAGKWLRWAVFEPAGCRVFAKMIDRHATQHPGSFHVCMACAARFENVDERGYEGSFSTPCPERHRRWNPSPKIRAVRRRLHEAHEGTASSPPWQDYLASPDEGYHEHAATLGLTPAKGRGRGQGLGR